MKYDDYHYGHKEIAKEYDISLPSVSKIIRVYGVEVIKRGYKICKKDSCTYINKEEFAEAYKEWGGRKIIVPEGYATILRLTEKFNITKYKVDRILKLYNATVTVQSHKNIFVNIEEFEVALNDYSKYQDEPIDPDYCTYKEFCEANHTVAKTVRKAIEEEYITDYFLKKYSEKKIYFFHKEKASEQLEKYRKRIVPTRGKAKTKKAKPKKAKPKKIKERKPVVHPLFYNQLLGGLVGNDYINKKVINENYR